MKSAAITNNTPKSGVIPCNSPTKPVVKAKSIRVMDGKSISK